MKTISTQLQAANRDVPLDLPIGQSVNEDHSPGIEVEATRSRALIRTAIEAIQSLDAQDLTALQSILQHGSTFGIWHTPQKWSPMQRGDATANVDLRKRIINFLPLEHQQVVRDSHQARDLARAVSATGGEAMTLPSSTARIESILDGAALCLTRYLVLCRIGPAGVGRKGANRPLDPSNVCKIGYSVIPALMAVGVSKWLDDAGGNLSNMGLATVTSSSVLGYFRLVRPEDLTRFSRTQQDQIDLEIRRMRTLADKGLWTDVPAPEKNSTKVTGVSGDALRPSEPKVTVKHLPLPDKFVSDMGSKSLWIIENLGPNLITIGEAMQDIWQRTDDPELKPKIVGWQRRQELKKCLDAFTWRDGSGVPISEPPFRLGLTEYGKNSQKGRNEAKQRADLDDSDVGDLEGAEATRRVGDDSPVERISWPPRTFGDIIGLMGTLQLAHMFVVGLSMGARRSEVLTLKRSCVEYTRNGLPYANGRTYKLIERHDGAVRDWVLPDAAVQAIEQQVRLVALAETIGEQIPERNSVGAPIPPTQPSTHLWAQISSGRTGDRTKILLGFNAALTRYAKTLEMITTPGGQNLHSHRLRKTLARIAALALTEAPKVLMNVFGHKSIEMTLYYILTDKDLQSDIEQVSRELRVIRALNTVQAIVAAEDARDALLKVATCAGMSSDPSARLVLGRYGGPASQMVSNAIKTQRERLHAKGDEWGAGAAQELAMILTLNGKAWQLVRPGVICTKFPGTESGPCNYSVGRPEPSRCRTSCSHRLEEGFLREDVDGSIRDAVAAYKEAGVQGEELTKEFWVGQILAHLRRFDDIHEKWVQDPSVKKLVQEAQANNAEGVSL